MTAATITELAHSSGHDTSDFLDHVMNIIDRDHRDEFMRGLSERIAATTECPGDDTAYELTRWIGSWYLSARLARDPAFVAADAEASKLIVVGDFEPTMSQCELRDRYRR